MSSNRIIKGLAVVLTMAVSQMSFAHYQAHEWGTFTSLVGSNGITQNGMYHEDEALPKFVHGYGEVQPPRAPRPEPPPAPVRPSPPPPPCRGKGCFDTSVYTRNEITQKMETPVIYFYADHFGGTEPYIQHVDVNVRFPQGLITETFPAPTFTYPRSGTSPLRIGDGEADFAIDILPQTDSEAIPHVDENNIYSHARKTQSYVVQSGTEVEKFIFYRGLGRYQPRLHISSEGGALELVGSDSGLPQSAFLVHVDENGEGRLIELGKLRSGEPYVVTVAELNFLSDHNQPVEGSLTHVKTGVAAHQALVRALVSAQLYANEAEAMVNTWEHGYLRVPGLRLLYILPRGEVDEVLPLKMNPAPEKLVRAFVGRIEIMLDTEEKALLDMVLRAGAAFDVRKLGRFADPMMQRLLQVYTASPGTSDGDEIARNKALLQNLIESAGMADLGNSIVE